MGAFAVQAKPGSILLEGELVFSTITAVRDSVERSIATAQGALCIDFAGVTRLDSSALSLWLCFERKADAVGIKLEVKNVPAELKSIAQLVGLEKSSLLL
ncbi:STAS domain-containing protein [Amphritea sp. HPY]|uniref:STAS domain-containing protein n=1 Tax=Amphritea sp. HPY TaxID=3421652 RepID=UPI003D7CE74C